MERVYNFSPGPAVLPEEVLKEARGAIWDFENTGIGILEHSHRSPEFSRVIERAEQLCRDLADIPDDYAVLFLQGGASTQFYTLPMNLLPEGGTADIVNTGSWSKKAITEAKKIGNVHVAASSEDENFCYIPKAEDIQWSKDPAYAYFTSNNTIFGTEWSSEPTPPDGVPLCCDASSDIFSRPIDVRRYGVIFAGAQKNLGPSGVTLAIVRKDLAERAPKTLPTMVQYRTHIEKGSRFNTPPTFGIYVLAGVLEWLARGGGLAAMAEKNQAKAKVLYDYLDQSQMFSPTARKGSRSLMNVCFRGPSEDLEAKFIAEAKEQGLHGLKGHRSVGGMRASIYNAFPKEGVERLVDFMKDFERANG